MLIRYADTLADVQAVAALEQVCFSRPWRQVDIAYFTTEASNVLLVAEEDGEVLGYVGMSMVLDEGQIQNIATAPTARRRGVASALLASLFEVGKALRPVRIFTGASQCGHQQSGQYGDDRNDNEEFNKSKE